MAGGSALTKVVDFVSVKADPGEFAEGNPMVSVLLR